MTTGLPKEAKPRDRHYDRGHDAVRADEKTMKPSQLDPKQVPGSRVQETPTTSPAEFGGHSGKELSHSRTASCFHTELGNAAAGAIATGCTLASVSTRLGWKAAPKEEEAPAAAFCPERQGFHEAQDSQGPGPWRGL